MKLELAEAKAALKALEGEVAPLRAKAAEYDAASKKWDLERTFTSAGLADAEGQDIARILHERIPEADRQPLADWLAAIKADPSTAPRALAPYLAPPAAAVGGAVAATTATAAASRVAANVGARVETAGTAGVAVTAEAIRAATATGLRTGDWKPYEGLKAALAAEKAAGR